MTTRVGLHGLLAPSHGARDSKMNEDNALASFAGVLAGVNQANAKHIAPAPQADGAPDGDGLENTDDTGSADLSAPTDDATGASASSDVAATTTVAGANANAVDSSSAALNPALQEKLARVISRMREETGHDVQVTETYRSQARQNALYAQGRQTAGPVVTWTQHSKHTQGRAVDVTLDGGRASADAYTMLQRIANEEGLRTLGAKDPGHLELASKSAATGQAINDAISVPDEPAGASGPGQISVARLAKVATIEQVSNVSGSPRVARVAAVAKVATIADATGHSNDEHSQHLDRLGDAVNASRVEDGSANNSQSFNSDRQSSDRNGSPYAAMPLRGAPAAHFSVADVATQMASTASQRAERIMAAQDAPARPLSQIVMSVDAGNGTTDRIHVALRGSTVSATIDAADHRAADAMRVHSDDLVRSLTKDGVEVESVRVRSAASATTAAQVTTVDASQKSSETSNHSRFSRESQWDQQRSHGRSNGERRQHQRDQRGGKES
jgi:uncharacterized protein YcbK (DUF882 family)